MWVGKASCFSQYQGSLGNVGLCTIHSAQLRSCFCPLPNTSTSGLIPRPNSSGSRLRLRPLIPRKTWQILLPMPSNVAAKGVADTQARSWLLINPDHTMTRFGTDGAEDFLRRHYSDEPSYLEVFRGLTNPALKSDFVRYLVQQAEGGVYTDLDTTALQPAGGWIPKSAKTAPRSLSASSGTSATRKTCAASSPIPFSSNSGHWPRRRTIPFSRTSSATSWARSGTSPRPTTRPSMGSP